MMMVGGRNAAGIATECRRRRPNRTSLFWSVRRPQQHTSCVRERAAHSRDSQTLSLLERSV